MIEKTKSLSSIEFNPDGVLYFAYRCEIVEDGKVLSTVTERGSLAPTEDLSGIDEQRIKAVAQATWTPEIIEKYKADQELMFGAPASQPESDG